jgi:integrase/recombinase XerD
MDNRAARVQVTGPLAPHADGFRTVLVERGYAPSSAAGQLQLMAHVSRWLVQRGLAVNDLGSTVVEQFLQARRAAGYGQWLSMRGMVPLLEYLRQVGLAPIPPPAVAQTPVQVLLVAYRVYLVEERGLAASTVRNYLGVAQQFVWDDASGHADLRGVTAAEVSEFVLTYCRCHGVGSTTIMVVGLRALLRYLHLAGMTPTGLAGAVPPAACWPATRLPRPITPGDARRLLASCDRRTAVGRRDFAVLTLMLRLGLRVSEVAALELGDVDWRHGEILIRGKGNRAERLPLPADVGDAVAGWLHRGRPPGCSSTRVFTRLLAPDGALSGKAVTQIVRRTADRCSVQASAHRLRHTAASDLLRAGASMPEVGQILRHTSILNTALYAKIDHAKLAAVARPWPAGPR